MTGPRVKKQTNRAAFTMEKRCLGCNIPKSVRSFQGHALCKQCRDNGPPEARAAPAPVVDEAMEAFLRSVREQAGVGPRRAG